MGGYEYALALVGVAVVSAVTVGLTTWVASTLRRRHRQTTQLHKLVGKLSKIRDGEIPREAREAGERPQAQVVIVHDLFNRSLFAGLIAIRLIAQGSNLPEGDPTALILSDAPDEPMSTRSEGRDEVAYRAIGEAHEAISNIIQRFDASRAVGWLDAFASLPAQLVTQQLDRAEPEQRSQLLIALAVSQVDAAAAKAVANI